MPPVSKTLVPSVIDRKFAETVDCLTLYEMFREKLTGSKITLTLRGCVDEGEKFKATGIVIQIPSLPVKLSTICPTDFDYFAVQADYTQDYLLPNQQMTRAEFLIELLDIWQAMRNRVSPHLKELGAELDLVMDYTRNIYSVRELADISYLEEGIKL